MGILHIIVNVESKIYYWRMTFMLLGYAKNHMGGTNRMLNMRTEHIIISRDVIWKNKTYDEYLSKKENLKVTTYILHNEDNSDDWFYVRMYPIKTKVKTEDVKYEHNVNTEKYLREKKTYGSINTVSFA